MRSTFRRSRGRKGAVVLAVVGVAVLAVSSLAWGAGTAGKPIKVGYLVPLTGNFAANGQNEANGFNLGLKVFSSNVAGHKIQVKYVDTQGDPTVALTQARKLVENDNVDIIEGPLVSNEIGAVTSYLGPKGIPTDDLALCSALQLDYYSKYNYGYSSGWACDQPALLGAVYAYKVLKWRKVAVAGQDFGFGWEVVGGFQKVFERLGGQIVKSVWVPSNATDYSPYISQIPSDVDGVYAEMSGGAAVRFTSAYNSFGLKAKVPLMGITQLTDYSALPAEEPAAIEGVLTSAQYCDGYRSPLNDTFTKLYKQKYGVYPGYYSDAGFTKARILVNALKKLKGNVSNATALTNALKATRIIAPRGPVRLEPHVLAPIQNIYICKVQRVKGELRNVPIFTYKNQPPWGPLSRTAWEEHFRHDSAARP